MSVGARRGTTTRHPPLGSSRRPAGAGVSSSTANNHAYAVQAISSTHRTHDGETGIESPGLAAARHDPLLRGTDGDRVDLADRRTGGPFIHVWTSPGTARLEDIVFWLLCFVVVPTVAALAVASAAISGLSGALAWQVVR